MANHDLPAPTPHPAFLTDDSLDVLRFAADAFAGGVATVLVTLVEIRGGAARPLGAHMAVREDSLYCGFVSGGCVERAVAFEALDVIALGGDRQMRYGQGSPYIDIVLPCGGGITLSLHRLRCAQPLWAVLAAAEQRRPAGLRYDPAQQTLQSLAHGVGTGWKGQRFEVGYRPCTRVLILGRSAEAEVTARLAQAAGYEVHASDGAEPGALSALIDADTAVVLLFHDLDRELPILQAALAAMPFYIGALGSHRTHQVRVRTLAGLGYLAQDIARIKAPIGIFPKARDAGSLALSVLADVAAARNGVPGKTEAF